MEGVQIQKKIPRGVHLKHGQYYLLQKTSTLSGATEAFLFRSMCGKKPENKNLGISYNSVLGIGNSHFIADDNKFYTYNIVGKFGANKPSIEEILTKHPEEFI